MTKPQLSLTDPYAVLPEALASRVVVRADGCWEWFGPRNERGYGRLQSGEHQGYVHRIVFALVRGPIVDDDVHHRCEFTSCVNPEHLENLSKTAHGAAHGQDVCKRGHVQTPENVYVRPDTGARMCWPCQQVRNVEANKRRAERCGVAGHPMREDGLRCKCGHVWLRVPRWPSA